MRVNWISYVTHYSDEWRGSVKVGIEKDFNVTQDTPRFYKNHLIQIPVQSL